MKQKYIVINQAIAIVFPICLAHKDVVSGVTCEIKSLNAGYCQIEAVTNYEFAVKCWGESKTLNVKSNPKQDEWAIKTLLYDDLP